MTDKDSYGDKHFQQFDWNYHQEQKKEEGFPWGPHKLPLKMEFEGVSISAEKREGRFFYQRKKNDGEYSKVILAEKGSLLINPVEPFHLPVGLATHLFIELTSPVLVEPKGAKDIYVTFPIELASIISHKQFGEQILDVFTLTRPKFTLYGSIKNGLICKYWQSEIHHHIPRVNPLEKGVIKLNIQNVSGRWVEVKKAVFSAPGMKIYYSPELVSLSATLKIINDYNAETVFIDEPLKKGMRKAVEEYSQRLLSSSAKTVMEEGY